MSKITIEQALDGLLSTLAGCGDINLSGQIYTPKRGVPYVSSRVAAYSRQALGTGANVVYQITGSYQITVVRPATEGKVAAGQIAGYLLKLFGRATAVTTSDGLVVNLLNASEMPDIEDDDWLSVPVVVSFLSSET